MHRSKSTIRHGVTKRGIRERLKAYGQNVKKEPTNKRCLLILDLNSFRS